MVHMICDPETLPYQIGDPRARRMSEAHGAIEKHAGETFSIFGGQLARASWGRQRRDTFDSSTTVSREPAMD